MYDKHNKKYVKKYNFYNVFQIQNTEYIQAFETCIWNIRFTR